MVYKFYDKKLRSGAISISKEGSNVNEVLAQELQKQLIKKFKKRKIHAMFEDNIWAADLAKMGSLSSKNWDVKYLLRVIDKFTKYA